MQSKRKTKRHWGILVFLILIVAALAGSTVYLLGVKGDWQDDIRATMDANVEYGGKMSVLEEARQKRIEFFLLRSIRELPGKMAYGAADFIRVLSVLTPPVLEYNELSIKYRLHSLTFFLNGRYSSDSYQSFQTQWQTFLQRLESELPAVDINPSLSGERLTQGEFVIEGELELL